MLAKKTRYTMVALVKLVKENGRGPILIKDIAKSENIPEKFPEGVLEEEKMLPWLR